MRHTVLNRKSIFVKIMAVYVAAMLALYAFSLYIYNSSLNSQKEKLTEQVLSTENRFIENIEQDVARVKTATLKAFLKPDWGVVSLHQGLIRDYVFLQNVLRAQERLEAIRNISPIIYDVCAYFPHWGRTLSSLNGLDDFDAEAFNSIMMPLDSKGAQFVYYAGQIYLTSAFRFKTPDNFSIVTRMDLNEIGNALKKLNITQDSHTLIIQSDTGEVIAPDSEKAVIDADAAAGSPKDTSVAYSLPKLPADPLSPAGSVPAVIGGNRYICVYRYSQYLGMTLVYLQPEAELYKPMEIYYSLIIIFTAVVLFAIAALVYYIYRVVGRPMKRLTRAFDSMEKGDFGVRLVPDAQDDFAYLYTAFDHMAENTQKLISEVYEKGLLVERARLKHLQAQINPHFLYNSFYTLHRMIKLGDSENAEVFSAKLGRYFQYITRDARDTVPLKTEAEHAHVYADIMAVRYGGAVDIEMGGLPAAWEDVQVPRLILQPLIENAFEHGMKQRTGKGLVKVSFDLIADMLAISVDDNGNGMEAGELEALNRRICDGQDISEITGLGNIHRRVRIAFGEAGGLAVERSPLGGTRVTLALPGSRKEEGA